MNKNLKSLFPLAIDYSLALLSAGADYARKNKSTAKLVLPFLVEIGFHTLFHLGSKGVLTFFITKKGRGVGVKALQWAFIMSKPVIQKSVLKPIYSHPKFHQASHKVEQICQKAFQYFHK